jgi:hypothetical protein
MDAGEVAGPGHVPDDDRPLVGRELEKVAGQGLGPPTRITEHVGGLDGAAI